MPKPNLKTTLLLAHANYHRELSDGGRYNEKSHSDTLLQVLKNSEKSLNDPYKTDADLLFELNTIIFSDTKKGSRSHAIFSTAKKQYERKLVEYYLTEGWDKIGSLIGKIVAILKRDEGVSSYTEYQKSTVELKALLDEFPLNEIELMQIGEVLKTDATLSLSFPKDQLAMAESRISQAQKLIGEVSARVLVSDEVALTEHYLTVAQQKIVSLTLQIRTILATSQGKVSYAELKKAEAEIQKLLNEFPLSDAELTKVNTVLTKVKNGSMQTNSVAIQSLTKEQLNMAITHASSVQGLKSEVSSWRERLIPDEITLTEYYLTEGALSLKFWFDQVITITRNCKNASSYEEYKKAETKVNQLLNEVPLSETELMKIHDVLTKVKDGPMKTDSALINSLTKPKLDAVIQTVLRVQGMQKTTLESARKGTLALPSESVIADKAKTIGLLLLDYGCGKIPFAKIDAFNVQLKKEVSEYEQLLSKVPTNKVTPGAQAALKSYKDFIEKLSGGSLDVSTRKGVNADVSTPDLRKILRRAHAEYHEKLKDGGQYDSKHFLFSKDKLEALRKSEASLGDLSKMDAELLVELNTILFSDEKKESRSQAIFSEAKKQYETALTEYYLAEGWLRVEALTRQIEVTFNRGQAASSYAEYQEAEASLKKLLDAFPFSETELTTIGEVLANVKNVSMQTDSRLIRSLDKSGLAVIENRVSETKTLISKLSKISIPVPERVKETIGLEAAYTEAKKILSSLNEIIQLYEQGFAGLFRRDEWSNRFIVVNELNLQSLPDFLDESIRKIKPYAEQLEAMANNLENVDVNSAQTAIDTLAGLITDPEFSKFLRGEFQESSAAMSTLTLQEKDLYGEIEHLKPSGGASGEIQCFSHITAKLTKFTSQLEMCLLEVKKNAVKLGGVKVDVTRLDSAIENVKKATSAAFQTNDQFRAVQLQKELDACEKQLNSALDNGLVSEAKYYLNKATVLYAELNTIFTVLKQPDKITEIKQFDSNEMSAFIGTMDSLLNDAGERIKEIESSMQKGKVSVEVPKEIKETYGRLIILEKKIDTCLQDLKDSKKVQEAKEHLANATKLLKPFEKMLAVYADRMDSMQREFYGEACAGFDRRLAQQQRRVSAAESSPKTGVVWGALQAKHEGTFPKSLRDNEQPDTTKPIIIKPSGPK